MPNHADLTESPARRIYIRGKTPGERIAYRRIALGLSQREVAERVGCTGGAIGHWERDRGRPVDTNAAALAEALEVPRRALRI